MKTIKLILSTTLVVALTSCSKDEFQETEVIIPIDVICSKDSSKTEDINSYITMQSGDILEKSEDNTSIMTYHSQNGTKKVCLISGSAFLRR